MTLLFPNYDVKIENFYAVVFGVAYHLKLWWKIETIFTKYMFIQTMTFHVYTCFMVYSLSGILAIVGYRCRHV